MNRKLLYKKDIIIIISLLLLAVIIYLLCQKFIFKSSTQAEILYNNNVIQTVDLSKDRVFSPDGFPNVQFEVKDGAIAFVKSDCPDKICIHTGFINKTGQSAVCLPNKLVLRLKSDDNDIDATL